MNARSRPPSPEFVLAFCASLALHLTVLLNVDRQQAHQAKRPVLIQSRLVLADVRPPPPSFPQDEVRPQRTQPRRTALIPPPAPPRLSPPEAVLQFPSAIEVEVPIDMRVREVLIASPATYGLSEKYTVAGNELPYAWSDDVDSPPSATSMSRTRYPSEAAGDGLVLVSVVLGANGLIEDHVVLCGGSPFEELASQSVAQWAFAPSTARGHPVSVWILLEFAFMRRNGEEGFDPSAADIALNSLREKCAESLTAQRR